MIPHSASAAFCTVSAATSWKTTKPAWLEDKKITIVAQAGPRARDLDAPSVRALRAAFDATMKDPEFLAEAAPLNFDVAPVSGEALQKIVEKVLDTPKDLAARA